MFDLSTVTFFGLSQTAMEDLSAVTTAIGEAQVLDPLDVYPLVDSLGGENLERFADSYFEAHRHGDVQGALSAKEKLLHDVATTKEILWKYSRPRPETKFSLFAAADAFRANADRILKVQAARRQQIVETGCDFKKATQVFQQIVLQALEGNELGVEQLEIIANGKSRLAPAAKMILEKFDRLKELMQTQTRLELAKKGSAIVEEERRKIFEELRTGRLQIDQRMGERILSLFHGPGQLIQAIDDLKAKSVPQWKEGRESKSHVAMHRLVNEISDYSFSGTLKDMSFVVSKQLPQDYIFSILSMLGKVTGLSAMVHSTVIKNIMAATAKGIRIEIDLPPDIPLDNEKLWKMEIVLIEMITNAVKYADSDKPEKWIRIGWDSERKILTIADNGIGIQDTGKIWEDGPQSRQAPDHAHGTGQGLAIVKRLLAEIGWTIEVRSTLGAGTTFTLVDRTARIALAKQLFRRRYEMSVEACRQIQQLTENDIEGLQRLKNQLRAEVSQSDKLFQAMCSDLSNDLMAAINSSSAQLPWSVDSWIDLVVMDLQKQKTWKEAVAIVVSPEVLKERKVIGDHGFRYNGTLGELSADLALHWLLSRSPLNNSWENDTWVLTFPKKCQVARQRPNPLNNSPWPPDPVNDIVLQTYLELLGWTMTVEEAGETVVVRIDFGENAV